MKISFDDNSYLDISKILSKIIITLAHPDQEIKKSLKIHSVEISLNQFLQVLKSLNLSEDKDGYV